MKLKNQIIRDRLLRLILPKRFYAEDVLITSSNHDFTNSPEVSGALARSYRASNGYNGCGAWKFHVALWAARTALNVPGDFVEFGVNYGVTASFLLASGVGRTFWLCDCWDPRKCGAQYSEVAANFSEWPNARLLKGWLPGIEQSIPATEIAFAHFDLNDGPAERATFKQFRHKLSVGAFLLLDDYGYPGFIETKRAWDSLGLNILSLPTGQGITIIGRP